jgi:hypothetical protein
MIGGLSACGSVTVAHRTAGRSLLCYAFSPNRNLSSVAEFNTPAQARPHSVPISPADLNIRHLFGLTLFQYFRNDFL